MPVFMAALGIGSSVTGLSSLSHLSFSDPSSSQYHHSPLSSFNFRSTLLKSPLRFRSLRVSVSVSDNGVAEKDTPPVGAQKSGDWEAARSYNESGLIHEGRVISGNGGGLMITFYSLVGFLPYSQLSPSHLSKEPKKPLRELAKSLAGSPIYVKVIKADEEKGQLILSEKQASWSIYSEKIKVGDILDGRVSYVEDYGAFIDLRFPDGLYHLTGMVHASEVSWDLVQDVRDILKVGDEVRVKVFNIDKEKSRVSLSIKLLEEDPLLQTLDKVIPQSESASPDSLSSGSGSDITPLPGLETIIGELLKEEGIEDVRISQQGFEKRVVSQDLQLWLSNAPPVDKQFTLLARAGRQVQEILLSTSLDQEGIKKTLQHVLERVP